jgi:hypothetical protein
MHVYNMIDMVRDLSARKSVTGTSPARTGYLDDVEILRFLNLEQGKTVKKIQSYRKGYLLQDITFSTDANGQYTIPVYGKGRPIHIRREDQASSLKIQTEQIHVGEAWFYEGDQTVTGREKWYYRNGIIEAVPNPGAVTNGWRMWIQWNVPNLHTGTAAGGADTTMTLASNVWVDKRNDYYNNIVTYIVSGTGADEYATITDYVGSTRVATIDFATTPDTTSIYAMESPVPEQWHDVIVYGAAILARIKAREKIDDLDKMQKEAYTDMIVDLETSQDVYPQYTEIDYDHIMMED